MMFAIVSSDMKNILARTALVDGSQKANRRLHLVPTGTVALTKPDTSQN